MLKEGQVVLVLPEPTQRPIPEVKKEIDEGIDRETLGKRILGTKLSKRVISLGGATLMAMVPVAAEAVIDLKPKEPVIEAGEMPSQGEGFVDIGSEEEVATGDEQTLKIDDVWNFIYKGEEIRPLTEDELEVTKNAFETWKKEKFGVFEKELRGIEGVKEERVAFCAKVLYCHKMSGKDPSGVFRFQDFLSKNEIIDYAKGGNNEMVLCNQEGVPRVWLVVAEEELKERALKAANEALKWFKNNKIPDMLDSSAENGLSVLFAGGVFPSESHAVMWLDGFGRITLNSSVKNLKKIPDENYRNTFIEVFWVEPYGVKCQQVIHGTRLGVRSQGFADLGYTEVIKSLIAGYVAKDLKGVDKDGCFDLYSRSFPKVAENFANHYSSYEIKTDSPITKRLLWLMAEFIRVPGFSNLRNVSSFNEVMGVVGGDKEILTDKDEVNESEYEILTIGSSGPEVAKLKQRMFELGYFKTNTVNESFTEKTSEYVKEFERINGLLVDGIADPEMQKLFFSEQAKPKN